MSWDGAWDLGSLLHALCTLQSFPEPQNRGKLRQESAEQELRML